MWIRLTWRDLPRMIWWKLTRAAEPLAEKMMNAATKDDRPIIQIQAGGLSAGDEISIDGGKTFRRVSRVTKHRGKVSVSFSGAARSLSFNDDEVVTVIGDL